MTVHVTEEALSTFEKIENALPQIRGLESTDAELDELSSLAVTSYKDLMDLGFEVEPRFSSEIFNSASSMLGHALTAKTAKINAKLKQLDLQLKKAQMDFKLADKNKEIENTPLGEAGQAYDRNELIRMMSQLNANNPKETDK